MQRTIGAGIAAIAAAVTIAGCSGGGSSPGGGGTSTPTAPPIVTESYTFPAGVATATTGTAWDITGIKTTLSGVYGGSNSYDTLRVDVTFAQNIANALPAPGQSLTLGTQLGVQIFFDVDGNPSTGSDAGCTTATPFEYLSGGTSRLTDGNYSIFGSGGAPTYEGNSNPAAEAVTSVSGTVFSQSFFLPTLSVFDGKLVPKIGIAAEAFNGLNAGTTDCVPSGNSVEVFTSAP